MNPPEPSVARALVYPQSITMVVNFLNHRSEEATVCKNSKTASMKLLEEADLPATAVGCIKKSQPSFLRARSWAMVCGTRIQFGT